MARSHVSPAECMRILGLSGPSSVEQIKRSYRELALRLHPDTNRGDEAARAQFVRVSEAYRTLIRAARAAQQGRKVGACAECGRFGEVATGLDGSSLCLRCMLEPGGGRLLPLPVLAVAKCLTTILLLVVGGYLLYRAATAGEPRLVTIWSLAALATGLLSLAVLALTCLTVVHCITDQERAVHRDDRRNRSRLRSWLRSRHRRRARPASQRPQSPG